MTNPAAPVAPVEPSSPNPAGPTPPAVPPASPPTPGAVATPGVGDWRESISPEFRDHASLKDIKDVDSLVKSYVHAQSMVGADKLVLPKDDSDPKLWDSVYNRLGRPEKPDGYKLPDVKLPDGLVLNPKLTENFLNSAHKLGVSQKQAAGLFESFLQSQAAEHQAVVTTAQAESEAEMETLKTEWGKDYDTNVNKAMLAFDKVGDAKMKAWLERTKLGDDPNFLRSFAKIYEHVSEDSAGGNGGGDLGKGSVEAGLNTIKEIKASPEMLKALHDRSHPAHRDTLEKWTNAHRVAFPGKSD